MEDEPRRKDHFSARGGCPGAAGHKKNDPHLMKGSCIRPKTVAAQTDSCRPQSPRAPHIKVAFLGGVFFSLEAVISGGADGQESHKTFASEESGCGTSARGECGDVWR